MAREIRILHTADTHLGYRQYHSEVRRQDFFKAFEVVIYDAVEMQVDAVVHAGDLFDSRNPTLEDLLETINILFRLKAAGIPFFGIVGNHESKQHTQWLDLFAEMGLAARLGKKPQVVENAAIYGIDSVPKSKIPVFDYSGFEAPESCTSLPENGWKLLVMHQIVQPFPYAEWDCAEVLEKLPFKIDAILLGDYHKYEKFKVGETWVTYPGSTERNSVSESEPRSYNIITLSDEGMEISRRTIPTRYFLTIPVIFNGEEKPYEQIFSAINEHLEELPGSVVFLEISGDLGAVLSLSEIEEYLLNKGVLVPRVRDLRAKESLPDEVLKVAFSDPDHAVANEIKRLSLNDGGLIIDEIVRNFNISRSRVDEETEGRLSKLIEAKITDFKDPDFRIEISAIPEDGIEQVEEFKPATESEFIMEIESGSSPMSLVSSGLVSELVFESKDRSVSEPPSEPSPKSSFATTSESVSESISESISESEFVSESVSKSVSQSIHELASEPISKSAFTPEASEFPAEDLEKEIKPSKKGEKEPEKEPGNSPESRVQSAVKASSGKETTCKIGEKSEEKPLKVADEKPLKASDIAIKTAKAGQKKGKGKPVVPRQYNLGDYL